MKHAVLLTLDAVTMEIVDSIAKQIATVHQSRRPAGSEIRPHITLGGCEDLDIERCEAVLSDLASTPHTCRFDSLGAFVTDPAVVFAAPVVTSGLLDLHTRFHDRFATIASEQCAYYLPGRWVPHCTLVEGLPLATLPEAMRIASTLALPLFATFAAIQIVDIPAARVLRTFSTTPD